MAQTAKRKTKTKRKAAVKKTPAKKTAKKAAAKRPANSVASRKASTTQLQKDLQNSQQRKKHIQGLTKFLVKALCEAAGIPQKEFFEHTRKQAPLKIRWLVCAVLRRRGFSFPEIGKVIDRKHSSVLLLLKKPCPKGYKTKLKQLEAAATKWEKKYL